MNNPLLSKLQTTQISLCTSLKTVMSYICVGLQGLQSTFANIDSFSLTHQISGNRWLLALWIIASLSPMAPIGAGNGVGSERSLRRFGNVHVCPDNSPCSVGGRPPRGPRAPPRVGGASRAGQFPVWRRTSRGMSPQWKSGNACTPLRCPSCSPATFLTALNGWHRSGLR